MISFVTVKALTQFSGCLVAFRATPLCWVIASGKIGNMPLQIGFTTIDNDACMWGRVLRSVYEPMTGQLLSSTTSTSSTKILPPGTQRVTRASRSVLRDFLRDAGFNQIELTTEGLLCCHEQDRSMYRPPLVQGVWVTPDKWDELTPLVSGAVYRAMNPPHEAP